MMETTVNSGMTVEKLEAYRGLIRIEARSL